MPRSVIPLYGAWSPAESEVEMKMRLAVGGLWPSGPNHLPSLAFTMCFLSWAIVLMSFLRVLHNNLAAPDSQPAPRITIVSVSRALASSNLEQSRLGNAPLGHHG